MRALVIVAALGSVAYGETKKPSLAQAKETATSWLDALEAKDVKKSWTFAADEVVVKMHDDMGDQSWCNIVECVGKMTGGSPSEWAAWTAKSPKKLQGTLKKYKTKLTALAKKATLVFAHEECAGEGTDLVVAVVLEGGAPKVSAAYYDHVFCGE